MLQNPIKFVDKNGLDPWFGASGEINIVGPSPSGGEDSSNNDGLSGGLDELGGVTGNAGALGNPFTGEVCEIAIVCKRNGLGANIIGGINFIANFTGPKCGKDLASEFSLFSVDAAFLARGAGVSFGGGGITVGIGIGLGASAGVDDCTLIVGKCSNTPCECKK